MKESLIKEQWKTISDENDWKDHILPKRTEEQFKNEGKLQADFIQDIIDSEFSGHRVKILEFGCGVGRVLEHINADELHGADASSKFLKLVTNPKIETHYSDGLSVIKNKNYFDFIYSLMVFQHNDKRHHEQILKNLHTCLNQDGKVFIQFPQRPNSYYKETSFVNLYERQEIQDLFESAGFSSIDITEGNLVAYGEHGHYKPDGYLEYFVLAKK